VRECISRAPWMGAFGMIVGVMALLGYVIGLQRLLPIGAEDPLTEPLTAVAIIATGLAILLNRPFRTSNASLLFGLIVGAIGVFILTNSGFAWAAASTHSRDLAEFIVGLFQRPFDTAASLALLGASITLVRCRKIGLAQLAAATAMLPSYIAFLGYLYGFSGALGFIAIPTIVGVAACGTAILFGTSYGRPMRPLLQASRSGGVPGVFCTS
jgi:hypothetical protein